MHERYDEFDLQLIIQQAMNQGERLDEGLSVFMARQLDYLKTRAYEVERSPLSALAIFPVTSELPDWAQTFTYGVWDDVGMAKIIADYSDDLPMVDVNYREEGGKIYRLGDAYGFSLDEAKASAATGKNLTDRKARAARKAFDTKVNDLVWKGEASHQILGLFQHPNIPTIVSAGWTTAAIASKELTQALTDIVTTTRGNHRGTNIVIPPSVNALLTEVMPNTATSYMEYFNRMNPGIVWNQAYELEDIDGEGTKAALVFEYDSDNLSIEMPEAFNQLAPQANNLHWKVPCTGKCTGLTVYRPLTMKLITGL